MTLRWPPTLDAVTSTALTSIQERLYPTLPCFGCGQANDKGLRLRSYPGPDGVVIASFTPWPEHDNGLGYLNGGIIGTVLDCHSAAAVMLEAERQGWPPLGDAALSYVTAGLDVRYLRPSPLHDAVELRAVVKEAAEPQITVDVTLVWDGKPRAEATAVWKRWRPRT
nr:PaaI family thioesterase [Saccharothrix mutabilis subsp. capreolus]